jgi:hypothetical protein
MTYFSTYAVSCGFVKDALVIEHALNLYSNGIFIFIVFCHSLC